MVSKDGEHLVASVAGGRIKRPEATLWSVTAANTLEKVDRNQRR